MATPLSAAAMVAALQKEGVTVSERAGWRTHNRNHKGPWGGVNGIVIHHTAGTNSLNLCWEGTSSLPGPLCHTHLAKTGLATMVGNGRANHAGGFAQNAHDAVVNESSTHPRPDSSEPVDGNRHYYGIEIENLGNGRDPYPRVQYDAAVRWAAAICRAHGWSANSVIGHKEGTRRKIDPSFDMGQFRADVAARLKAPAGGGTSDPAPAPQEDVVPQYVSIGRGDWMTVAPGKWDAIEFTDEFSDAGHHHWDKGGSQFVNGPALFQGQVGVIVDGLSEGAQLQVMLSEVKDGKYVKDHDKHDVVANPGDAYTIVPLTGSVPSGHGMRVRVKHWETGTVRVKAYLKALIWEQ